MISTRCTTNWGTTSYQRAYSDQSFIFRNGANDGFHEAIGDFAGLNALTPDYLKQLGLIDAVPGPASDIPYLLKMALDKVAILPFALVVDKWRWGVFNGTITPDHYNDAWWDLVEQYQGLTPPGPRPADAFDPGAKFHIADNTPYIRYFLADIYEFQFYRAACRLAGWSGQLNRCNIYGNKQVGEKFNAMLKMGQSKPWPEALAAFTGEAISTPAPSPNILRRCKPGLQNGTRVASALGRFQTAQPRSGSPSRWPAESSLPSPPEWITRPNPEQPFDLGPRVSAEQRDPHCACQDQPREFAQYPQRHSTIARQRKSKRPLPSRVRRPSGVSSTP